MVRWLTFFKEYFRSFRLLYAGACEPGAPLGKNRSQAPGYMYNKYLSWPLDFLNPDEDLLGHTWTHWLQATRAHATTLAHVLTYVFFGSLKKNGSVKVYLERDRLYSLQNIQCGSQFTPDQGFNRWNIHMEWETYKKRLAHTITTEKASYPTRATPKVATDYSPLFWSLFHSCCVMKSWVI